MGKIPFFQEKAMHASLVNCMKKKKKKNLWVSFCMLFHLHVLPTLLLEGKHPSGVEAEHFQTVAEHFQTVPRPTLSHANNENTGITTD